MVALSCPMLWTKIKFSGNRDRIEEFLIRSKRVALSIHRVTLPSKENERILLAELPRIETLRVVVDTSKEFRGPVDVKSAPMLKNLQLESILCFNGDINEEDSLDTDESSPLDTSSISAPNPDWIPFANILYGDAAPYLQKIKLVSIPFSWPRSFCHANLRDLRIVPYTYRDHLLTYSTGGSPENVIAALEAMPLLEVLFWGDWLLHDFPPACSESRLVTLPHLRSITILTRMTTCANILTYLNVRPDSSIRVAGDLTSSLEALKWCMASFNEHYPFQHLAVSNSSLTFRIAPADEAPRPSTRYFDPDLEETDVRPCPELVFGAVNVTETNISHIETALLPFSEGLPLSCIVKLSIRRINSEPRQRLVSRRIFKQMPHIRTLCIDDVWDAYDLSLDEALDVQVPSGDPAQSGGNDCPLVLLPQLQELILEEVNYDARYWSFVEGLIACVQKRRKNDFGPHMVLMRFLPFCRADVTKAFEGIEWAEWGLSVVFEYGWRDRSNY